MVCKKKQQYLKLTKLINLEKNTIIIILKKVLNVKCFKRLITNIFQKNFAQFFKRPFKPAAEAAATN